MLNLPHDVTDLHLAPVALEVDARITELGTLTDDQLALQIAIASNEPDWSVEIRKDGLMRTVGHMIELHDWVLSWDERGIRLSHGERSLVIGVPPNFGRYVEGVTRA